MSLPTGMGKMSFSLSNYKVIVCCGSGGVGKTTISSCLGVAAAREGARVLVLTIDPARRLATSLGLDSQQTKEVKVPGQNFSGELYAAMINPEEIFAQFVRDQANDSAQAERLLNNRLYEQLSTTFSGSQEFTSLEKLASVVESGRYDLVILDTPPAQHAVDFLNSPQKLYTLFQEKITRWFVNEDESMGFFQKIVNRGTKTVFKALEKLTGAEFIRELSDFFASVGSVQEAVSRRSMEVHKLLTSPEAGFIVVTGLEPGKLTEADYFRRQLMKSGYKMAAVIVNRSFPLWFDKGGKGPFEFSKDNPARAQELKRLYSAMLNYHEKRKEVFSTFVNQIKGRIAVACLPEMNKDIYGLSGIELLSDQLNQRWETK